jgi:putative N6-adenine-specific DNA methylase
VCDRFRERAGRRPSVDVREPRVQIYLHLDRLHYTLYIDTSGPGLFRRGDRRETGAAPLKKNLAAGILHLAGWQPGMPLFDPMCGSGTFLSEAAQITLKHAAGMGRHFAFEDFQEHDRKAWFELLSAAEAEALPPRVLPIWGSDIHGPSVGMTRDNLEWLGLDGCVSLHKEDVLDCSPPAETGMLVTNPPYGVRVGEDEEMAAFYPELGRVLKQRFAGWNAYILSGDLRLAKLIRLAASRRTPLFNGQIECRLFEYRMVAGSNRKDAAASEA